MAEEKKNAKPAATAKNTNAVKKEDKKLGFFQRMAHAEAARAEHRYSACRYGNRRRHPVRL